MKSVASQNLLNPKWNWSLVKREASKVSEIVLAGEFFYVGDPSIV